MVKSTRLNKVWQVLHQLLSLGNLKKEALISTQMALLYGLEKNAHNFQLDPS